MIFDDFISLDVFSNSFAEVYEVSVSYLPPVKMFFSLPDGYPSENAPEYILTAQWWPQQIVSAFSSVSHLPAFLFLFLVYGYNLHIC